MLQSARQSARSGRLETVSFAAKLLRSRHWVTPMDDLFGEAEWKVVITHCVNEAHKTDWAAWVSQLGDDHFREGTEPLATAILGALTRMGIFEN